MTTARLAEHPNLVGVTESETLAMARRAAELDSPERPVISLSAGEPDFPTPAYIAEAGIAAIRAGHTHYPPAGGLVPLKAAIAAYLGSSLAEYAGMSAAMSIIGALFLIGVIVWLWKRQTRQPAS